MEILDLMTEKRLKAATSSYLFFAILSYISVSQIFICIET